MRPPVAPVFFGFRVMVGIGVLMLSLVAWSAVQWRRGPVVRIEARVARVDVDDARGLRRRARGLVHDGDRPPAVRRLRPAAHFAGRDCNRRRQRRTSLIVFATVYLFVFIAGTLLPAEAAAQRAAAGRGGAAASRRENRATAALAAGRPARGCVADHGRRDGTAGRVVRASSLSAC